MLTAIVRFSLRFRGVVLVLACLFLGYGGYLVSQSKFDVFPEFAPPLVSIQTEAPGLAAEQVELLVTTPIENAINGVEGVDSLRSNSIQGLSVITVIFHPRIDIYRARQILSERLTSATSQLPPGFTPRMAPLTSSTGLTLILGLTSQKVSLMDLRSLADWTVRQRLLSVPGVAQVTIYGGEVKQLQIQVIPDRLIRYGFTVNDVLEAGREATGIKGAGFVDTSNQRIILQTEGQSVTPEQLSKTLLVKPNGINVRLGDLAQIVEAPEPPFGAATVMKEPGVLLDVVAQYGANTLDVTKKVEEALKELKPALEKQGVVMTPDLFRPANFIQTALQNLRFALLMGALLVMVVLALFLFDWRTAVISCTAIPLSLVAGATVLGALGYSLNTMTLGGLAIAIGEVVDDAIIDVENILRRLRDNRHAAKPQPILFVVLDASIEVRSAVVYATLTVILVFLPILAMSGVAGRLFAPLATGYIVAVLASLLVALTVTPAMSFLMLGGKDLKEEDPPLVRWLKEIYRPVLETVERAPRLVMGGIAIFVALALAIFPVLRARFLPELREGHFIVHMSAIPGTSLEESIRTGRLVASQLLELPSVRSVAQQVGRAEQGEDTWGPHYSEVHVDLKKLKGKDMEIAQSEIAKRLAQFPGFQFSIKTFLTERIEEVLSGYTAAVVINVVGPDLDVLDQKAKEIAQAVSQVQGAEDVQIPSPPGVPELIVHLDKEKLLHWGIQALPVLEAVQMAYQGTVVGQVYQGNQVHDISVILHPSVRKAITEVGSLPLAAPSLAYVRLAQVADLKMTSGRYAVLHEGARRVQTITCNVNGKDLDTFVAEAGTKIASTVQMPPGTYVQFSGTAQAQAQSRRDLLIYSLVAIVGIVLLLSIVLGNSRNLILVLTNLPFALVGGVLAVFATGGELSMGSLVGFVTLFGITLRNSIMMISHYEHLVQNEGMTWGLPTALRGASERLAPILMTASITALGLLPLAIGHQESGKEIEGPMALVILGGLATSTILNLVVLPTLALRFGRFKKDQLDAE